LVLSGTLKDDLTADCIQFFEARELYPRYQIPWKRGYLLMGPPANGKSHMIKALLNRLQKQCIYVQSFQSHHATEHQVMRTLFERARMTTPCILVLEDLDSLINDGNRSFFLNELEGFAANHGILTIASTNHPERLDPAILERPSRFDRKYTFRLPGREERARYLELWDGRLESELRLSEHGLGRIVESTEDFSFAYLKELLLSSMMAWIREPRPMDGVASELVDTLRQQLAPPAPV
jgi:ATP-dependent 26S proteasome regulatory subunit